MWKSGEAFLNLWKPHDFEVHEDKNEGSDLETNLSETDSD